ncbi:MAG: hypothetical protein ACOCXQ_02130 [Patescibacteria group bacterium]
MFKPETAVFVGKDRSRAFRDFIIDGSFFLVFEALEGLHKAEGHDFIKQLERLKKQHGQIINLNDLEIWLQESLLSAAVPAHFSLAAGAVYKNILYIKTVGEGEVHMRRGKRFARLIHGDKTASGYLEENDMVVFTTASYRSLIEEEVKLEKPLNTLVPEKLVQHMEEYFDNKNDKASLAIFAQFSESGVEDEAAEMGFVTNGEPSGRPVTGLAEDEETSEGVDASDPDHHPNYHSHAVESTEVLDEPAQTTLPDQEIKPEKAKKKRLSIPSIKLPGSFSKKVTLVAVIVIFAIFVWSIIFGYQRRQEAALAAQVEETQAVITEKTAEAEEIAFLNLDRAIALLDEAKLELAKLEESAGEDATEEIAALREQITTMENKIVQKDEQEPEEFYDLALEAADARGDAMFKDGTQLAILDRENKTVYNFSLDEKSLEKSTNEVVSAAELVGIADGTIYVFDREKGLYEFENDEDVSLVIEEDEEWGEVVDLAFYFNNVYMLDREKADIYKYVPVEGGYSEQASYFVGTAPTELNAGTSIAIDASIYVGLDDSVLKFTRGEADEFVTTFPTENVTIEGIYTDEESEKVYVWDKEQGAVYVLSKNGKYERQVRANALKEASDITVYNNQILVLSGSKIYALTENNSSDE